MVEENDKIVEDTLVDPEPTLDEEGNDTTDWKAEALKRHGLASRNKKDLDKTREDFEAYKKANPEEPIKAPEQPQDKTEFDYAEKAFLLAKGIKETQFPIAFQEKQASGLPLERLLDSKYFKEKLELETTKEAVPESPSRGGGNTRDTESYWIAKGELPPRDQVDLRRKVVNAKLKKIENKSKFTDSPIV